MKELCQMGSSRGGILVGHNPYILSDAYSATTDMLGTGVSRSRTQRTLPPARPGDAPTLQAALFRHQRLKLRPPLAEGAAPLPATAPDLRAMRG
jgi:hypothetical protein